LSNVELNTSVVKSSWNTINQASKKDTIESTLFSLLINVGVKPTNQQLSYIILPGLSISESKKAALNLPLKIIQNDSHLQSVYHTTLNMIQIVVYDSGTVRIPWSDQIVNIHQPALIILKKSIGKYLLTIQQDGKCNNYTIDANVPFETPNGSIKIHKKM
jgi:chondroitin AC lyase